jgi:hypothetical protein
MPEMAAAEAELANDVNQQGWLYLEEMLYKWRNKPEYVISAGEAGKFDNGGQEPYMVEWEWLMKYARFREAVAGLIERANLDPDSGPLVEEYLFSPAACAKLVKVLRKGGDDEFLLPKPEDELWLTGGTFNHSALSRDKQRRHAFQNKSASPSLLKALAPGAPAKPDGLYAVLGRFTVYALVQGELRIADDIRRVTVHRVFAFIHDGFDFSGEQWLGNWECSRHFRGFASVDALQEARGEEKGRPPNLPSRLDNKAYREFRRRSGFGCDFRTMCAPHLVWEGEFRYDAP